MRHFTFIAYLSVLTLAEDVRQAETLRSQRQLAWYSSSWPFYFNYPEQNDAYQFRSLPIRPGFGYNPNANSTDGTVEGRLGFRLLNGNFLSSRPAAIRNSFVYNLPSAMSSPFDSCTSIDGESGICTPGPVCSVYGGRASGFCASGTVCCINVVSTCSSHVTLNNTYWESSSSAITRPGSCSLLIKVNQEPDQKLDHKKYKLNHKLLEKKQRICQIRLDLISFSIEQPVGGTCSRDAFQVTGGSSAAPEICGDNPDQHMYIDVTGTTGPNVLISFNFAKDGTVIPHWKIKIAFLPCCADYLAPSGCLQYFTSTAGTVKSFNFKSVQETRQLNNQDYNICFRTELIAGRKTNEMCITPCADANQRSFLLSGPAIDPTIAGISSQIIDQSFCNQDYLLFPGGTDGMNTLDRYCGTALNPASGAPCSVKICSTRRPFVLGYVTDDTESDYRFTTPAPSPSPPPSSCSGAGPGPRPPTFDLFNTGFCLTFQQFV